MPAWRVDNQARAINRYDVGASDGDQAHFVAHVILCNMDAATITSASCSVQAIHMGPPLKSTPATVDAIGSAELDPSGTNRGERLQIKSFIDDRLLEQRAQTERRRRLKQRRDVTREYTVHPAVTKPNADYPLWRFSCSGFVLQAYLEANIELIDHSRVPSVEIESLKQAYPSAANWLDDADFRTDMGLGDGSEWPVILAGYLVNSLARSGDEIRRSPYSPERGDEYFPSRASRTAAT